MYRPWARRQTGGKNPHHIGREDVEGEEELPHDNADQDKWLEDGTVAGDGRIAHGMAVAKTLALDGAADTRAQADTTTEATKPRTGKRSGWKSQAGKKAQVEKARQTRMNLKPNGSTRPEPRDILAAQQLLQLANSGSAIERSC
ncbi:hypothetical protein LTR85_007689 [Meristemomyces frigidus]|nr:hypothetical protein LTR85_007689 [Meristemomyces frigidus]